MTQRELARRLDRAHSYVSRIEKGDRRLDVPEMIQWCEVLGVDPVEVMKRIMRRSGSN
jgi:transcriptional regulator with XRE-family HTH domain